MRHTGILRSWHPDRGFGFIAPTQGGRELFVHISALPRDGTQPVVGETLTYLLGRNAEGKPQAVQVERAAFGAAREALPRAAGPRDAASAPDTWHAPLGNDRPRRTTAQTARASRAPRRAAGASASGWWRAVVGLAAVLALAGYGHSQWQQRRHAEPPPSVDSVLAGVAAASAPPRSLAAALPSDPRCDGRTHCSQMTSCAEAKYFLAHCPGVQMDGDGDGLPCESQHCGQQ